MTNTETPQVRLTVADLRGLTTISVEEAASVLGMGRSRAFDAIHSGEIPSLRFGRTVRVPVPALLRMLGASVDQPEA